MHNNSFTIGDFLSSNFKMALTTESQIFIDMLCNSEASANVTWRLVAAFLAIQSLSASRRFGRRAFLGQKASLHASLKATMTRIYQALSTAQALVHNFAVVSRLHEINDLLHITKEDNDRAILLNLLGDLHRLR